MEEINEKKKAKKLKKQLKKLKKKELKLKKKTLKLELSIKLSEKQKEIFEWCKLGNGIQYVVVSTGRQVGKSTISTIVGLDWCLQKKNYTVGFFMPTYKQCKNIFKRYKKMLKDLIVSGFVRFVASPDLIITFANGSTIQFFTSENDNCRSFTFDSIIVDEACFIKDEIWTGAIQPTVQASLSKNNEEGIEGFHGKVLIVSTPKEKNWFYNLVMDDNSERKRVTRFTTVEGGIISALVVAQTKKEIPENIFKCEYEGIFLDGGNGMFEYKGLIIDKTDSTAGHCAGIDIANKDDWTVLTIQDKFGNVIFQDRWRHQKFEIILETIIKILKKYNNPSTWIEKNGVGEMPLEYLKSRYKNTFGWHTSQKSKNDIMQRLILDFNTKNITLLKNDFICDELDYYTVIWKNGKPSYNGGGGFHDDGVMSLAICNYHRDKVSVPISVNKIKRTINKNKGMKSPI